MLTSVLRVVRPPSPVRRRHAATGAAAALAMLACLFAVSHAAAQGAGGDQPMVIVFPHPHETLEAHAGEHVGERDWFVAIFADGELCGRVPFPSGDSAEVTMGSEHQPAACGTPGASLRFVSSLGYLLPFEAMVTPGETLVFDGWAPPNPHGMDPEFACRFLDEERFNSGRCPSGGPPGVIHWTFSERDPLVDPRFATVLVRSMAVETSVDIEHVTEAWPDAEITIEYEGTLATDEGLDPAELDATELLTSAGLLDSSGDLVLEEARPCAIWFVPTSAVSNEVQRALVDTLAHELPRALAEFGVDAEPCRVTSDASAADLLVWDQRYPPHELAPPSGAGGFLGPRGAADESPPPAAAGHGPGNGERGRLSGLVLTAGAIAGSLAVAGAAGWVTRRASR